MKLFSTNDRNLAHKKLEEVLAYKNGDTPFPNAFCTEDFNTLEPYEVHHGTEDLTPAQKAAVPALITFLKR